MILEHIFKTKGTFFPVGPGKPFFRLKITVSRTQYSNYLRTAGGNSRSKRYTRKLARHARLIKNARREDLFGDELLVY